MKPNYNYPELDTGGRIKALIDTAKQIEPEADTWYVPQQGMLYCQLPGMPKELKFDCPEIPAVHGRELSEPTMVEGERFQRAAKFRLDLALAGVAGDVLGVQGLTKEQAKKALALEYKIHMMPKRVYMEPLFADLVRIFRDDIRLRAMVACFKMWVVDDALDMGSLSEKPQEDITSRVVIYPLLRKRVGQEVLDALCKAISPAVAEKIGIGVAPRFSCKIDKLTSYGQSGGDLKKVLDSLGIDRDKIFTVHGRHVLGYKALQHPALGEPTVLGIPAGESGDDLPQALGVLAPELYGVETYLSRPDPAEAPTETPFKTKAEKLRAAINLRSRADRTRAFRELGNVEGVWQIAHMAFDINDRHLALLGCMLILEFFPKHVQAIEMDRKLKEDFSR